MRAVDDRCDAGRIAPRMREEIESTLLDCASTLKFGCSSTRTMTQLAWQAGHAALFQRYGGVPRWVRIDNLKSLPERVGTLAG